MKYFVPMIAAVGSVTLAIVGIVTLTAAAQEYVLDKEFRFGSAIQSNRDAIERNGQLLQQLLQQERNRKDESASSPKAIQLTQDQFAELLKRLNSQRNQGDSGG